MGSSILSVGQSALAAAQVGLLTTGHNIANANTPGYSRQIVVQGTASSQDSGFGFVGKGTEVVGVKRVFNEFLANRVMTTQTSYNELDTYYSQIKQINNLFADTTSGLSPRLQEFFKGVQNLAADPNSAAARQSLLSSAETLSSQFKSMDGQLREMRDGVNTQIITSVGTINSYAQQIAKLNDAIEKAMAGDESKPANDLLDQRDQIVSELSKEIKVSVVKQNDSYNVFIGSGQPLVVGTKPFDLKPVTSDTDLSRIEVGYNNNGTTITLAEDSLTGGRLGGLLQFRSETLDTTQNALNRLAVSIATTFNAQHRLGQDQSGALGGDFFSFSTLPVSPAVGTTGVVSAAISDAAALTTSDYQLKFDGTNYTVTRLSDGRQMYNAGAFPGAADVIEGVTLTETTAMAAGDSFLIRPAYGAATNFAVALTNKAQIAAAAPVRTGAPTTNTGTGRISAGTIDATYTAATLTPAVTLTYDKTANTLSGFPVALSVDVTVAGVTTNYPSPVASIPYTSGATISFGGVSVAISDQPANGDTFTIGQNTNGSGDNRNALLLAALQSANTMDKNLTTGLSTTTFQGAYAQLVNQVGNKTHELEVTSSAESKLMAEARKAHQADSGVSLDEEATNLIRYQQAYQAAGKVMQTASQLFDILLTLGG
ncbi:MAG TPA: flagellar hook-associated protein FlgK [Paucimonas sp.]|nr:flagellar hook-associated protein FlgK [Paucimonas sp.]